MEKSAVLIIILAVAIRLTLFSSAVSTWFVDRNEFATPISSWKRLTEGLTLLQNGVSPYEGDLYHEMPLTLSLWRVLIEKLGVANMKFFFVLMDVLIGCALYSSCHLFSKDVLEEQERDHKSYHKTSAKLLVSEESMQENKLLCLTCYLLNPLTIASCLSMNTAILNNLTIILSFHSALKRNRITLSIFLALSTYLSFYPFILIIPLSIVIAHHDKNNNPDHSYCNILDPKKNFPNPFNKTTPTTTNTSIFITSMLQTTTCFICLLLLLIFFSDPSTNHDFISSTFGFILSAPDHSPNIGIFWYFFIEHFEHFKFFFLCVFQIHAILYSFPLSIRLLHHPYFAAFTILAFFSIFKSYPSYTELTLWIAIVFQFKFVFKLTRNIFVTLITLVICSVLGVVFQYLWLQSGSANANFYFAATLGITASQVIFLFDIIFSHQKRLFEMVSGTDNVGTDGKPARYFLE